MRIGPYVLGALIGSGTYGNVYYGAHVVSGLEAAVKVVAKSKIVGPQEAEQLGREVSSLKRLAHRNIIRLIDVLKDDESIYLILELASGGELYQRIEEQGYLTEDEAAPIMCQILEALRYMHSRSIAHRDIRPENILFDRAGVVKIADFGLATLVGRGLNRTLCGSPHYVAPEVFSGQAYDGRIADVWSAGVTLYVMLCGRLPFDDENEIARMRKIRHAEFAFPPASEVPLSDAAMSLIRQILKPTPGERPSVHELLDHSWIARVTVFEMILGVLNVEALVQTHITDRAYDHMSLLTTAEPTPALLAATSALMLLPDFAVTTDDAAFRITCEHAVTRHVLLTCELVSVGPALFLLDLQRVAASPDLFSTAVERVRTACDNLEQAARRTGSTAFAAATAAARMARRWLPVVHARRQSAAAAEAEAAAAATAADATGPVAVVAAAGETTPLGDGERRAQVEDGTAGIQGDPGAPVAAVPWEAAEWDTAGDDADAAAATDWMRSDDTLPYAARPSAASVALARWRRTLPVAADEYE